MDSEYILAFDIGTSSVRAGLYDLAGNLLPKTLVKFERALSSTADGGAEIDVDEALEQVVLAVDAVLEVSSKIKGEITHVASCAFWHSLVGVDAKGKPTTKVLSWADTRSRDFTPKLRERLNEHESHNRTGARFHSSFWPAKLLWLRNETPEIWQKTAKWLSLSDYVASKLCGDSTTSISIASGTGVFNVRKCQWDDELLRHLEVGTASLPDIAPSNGLTFTLLSKWKKRWPRLANAKCFPAIADGVANNVGCGCTTRSMAALMIGTSGAMRVVYRGDPPSEIPDGLFCYRVDERRVVVGGALSDGGGLYAWLKKNLRMALSDTEIGAETSRRGADAHDLTVMPFFFGERSTGYNEDARGSILGLTARHDAIDILQAAMESVAYRFAEIFDQLNRVTTIGEIIASGGALENSRVWTQMLADVLGRDLTVSDQPEASMRGAVLLALESLGKIESIYSVLVSPSVINFHPKRHEIYKTALSRHDKHY